MNEEELLIEGGPTDVPAVLRVAGAACGHLKIPRLGGYEHYEFHGYYRDVGQRMLRVFQWTYRTKIAE